MGLFLGGTIKMLLGNCFLEYYTIIMTRIVKGYGKYIIF